MSYHDPLHCAPFGFDHVAPVNGHWIAVLVVFECGRQGSHATKLFVKEEMPVRNAA
jgi:hypothetical protein